MYTSGINQYQLSAICPFKFTSKWSIWYAGVDELNEKKEKYIFRVIWNILGVMYVLYRVIGVMCKEGAQTFGGASRYRTSIICLTTWEYLKQPHET